MKPSGAAAATRGAAWSSYLGQVIGKREKSGCHDVRPSSSPYSPNLVESEFCEVGLRVYGILRSSRLQDHLCGRSLGVCDRGRVHAYPIPNATIDTKVI